MSRANNWDVLSACLLALGVALFGLLSQDKQGIYMGNHICGIYCSMAVNYGEYLSQQNFDSYYFQKSLLSFFAWIAMTLGEVEKTPFNANRIMEIMSAVLITGSAWLWGKVARYHALSRSAFWVAAFGMFLCQLFVKLVPYAQESPDTAAFFLGILSLYTVTCARHSFLIPVYILSSFVQPQLAIFLVPVYLFSYGVSAQANLPSAVQKMRTWVTDVVRKIITWPAQGGWLLFGIFSLFLSAVAGIFVFIVRPMHGTDHSIFVLLPVSILLCAGVLSYLLYKIRFFSLVEFVIARMGEIAFWRRFGIIVLIQLAIKMIVAFLGRGPVMSGASTTLRAIYTYLSFYYQSIEQPLKMIVAPTVFYGAIFVLVLLSLRRVRLNLLVLADSLPILCGIVLLILLFPDTESRHFIAFLPWFVLLAVKGRAFHPLYIVLFFVLSLVGSRFYAEYAPLDPIKDTYLMTWGPWFTQEIYWRGVVLTLVLFLALWKADKTLKVKTDD